MHWAKKGNYIGCTKKKKVYSATKGEKERKLDKRTGR